MRISTTKEDTSVVADRYGMEYLFLRVFFENADLYGEFPMIAHEFLKHEFGNLEFYHDVDYGADTPKEAPKTLFLNMKILSLIYQAARKGSEYSTNLLIYLYKIYYRQEYNALRRFKIINSEDALELTKCMSGAGAEPAEWRFPRIFLMAPFLNVELGDIEIAYSVINETWRRLDNNKRSFLDIEIPSELLDQCREQIRDWMDACDGSFDKKTMPHWWKARKLVCASLQINGYTQTYITEGAEGIDRAEEELNMIRTLALLKMNFPRKTFTFDEVQTLSVSYMLANKMTRELGRINVAVNDMLGISAEYVLSRPKRARFQPEKVTGEAGPKRMNPVGEETLPEPEELKHDRYNSGSVSSGTSSTSKAEKGTKDHVDNATLRENKMQSEIEKLRTRLHNVEQENMYFRELNRELRESSEDVRMLKQQHEDDRKELHALREHVYHSTEDDIDVETPDTRSMENVIAEKRIVIIGGHDNWTNKLKVKFDGWKFISTDISAMVDLGIFNGADYTYFFTEYLSHRTYGAYVKALRERNLPFGYIHSTNVEKNIRQIYEDVVPA